MKGHELVSGFLVHVSALELCQDSGPQLIKAADSSGAMSTSAGLLVLPPGRQAVFEIERGFEDAVFGV